MDATVIGANIRQLRLQKNYTQKELADLLCVSDKAVSKWECSKGCPDISLLSALALVLETDLENILGDGIETKEKGSGNMKKMNFYVCPTCGNILTSASKAAVSCCGKTLKPLIAQKAEPAQKLNIEEIEGEWFVSSDHSMTKEHYISFLALLNGSTVHFIKQYPEWNLQARLPRIRFGRLLWYCTKCGLFYQDIKL